MINLILAVTDATTSDPEFLGKLVIGLGSLAACGVGGWGAYKLGTNKGLPDPINVRAAEMPATKDDLKKLVGDIRDEINRVEKRVEKIEQTQRIDINNVYNRINAQGEALAEVLGILKGIDARLNPHPPRTRK